MLGKAVLCSKSFCVVKAGEARCVVSVVRGQLSEGKSAGREAYTGV